MGKKTAEEKRAAYLKRKAKRRNRRRVLGRIFNVLGPLAEKAVLAAAHETGLDGDGRAAFAVAHLAKLLDAAIVLPQPWEALSDVAIKGLSAVLTGAVENAFEKLRARETGTVDE